jgi:DNA-binding transcriptional LysR family regulator
VSGAGTPSASGTPDSRAAPGTPSLPQLEAVLAVIDEGSFTLAAQALEISQPSLSRRIHGLEETLGIRVFLPVGRQMRLTDAGGRVARAARRTVQELADLSREISAPTGELTGTLRAAGLPSLVATRLPQHLGALHRQHPQVRIEVFTQEDREQLAEAVRSGKADVALTAGAHAPPDLESIPLRAQQFVAVLPAEQPAGTGSAGEGVAADGVAGEQLTADVLAARTLVSLPVGTSIREVTESVYRDLGVAPARIISTTQRDSLVPLAIASGALTIVPEDLAEGAAASGGRVLDLPTPVQRSISALHRRETLPTPALTALLELLRED